MALVSMKKLLENAEKNNIAVGAFNVGNMEMVMGAVAAAEELNMPIILQIAECRLKNSPLELMGPMMISAAKNSNVDIAVHLDHGLKIETVQKALEMGFTSVMFDGSTLPLEENIKAVKQVREMADKYGATVEAELGVVGGNEGDGAAHEILCTNPDDAKLFCDETGVDALAVAIGNAHGNYPVAPKLKFDVLKAINAACKTPLVLHGGTGIEPEDFIRCHQNGIKKINIATATFAAAEGKAREGYEKGTIKGYYDLHQAEIAGAYENAKKHMEIFYSVGKAE